MFDVPTPLRSENPTVEQDIIHPVFESNGLGKHHADQIHSLHTCLLTDPAGKRTAIVFSGSGNEPLLVSRGQSAKLTGTLE